MKKRTVIIIASAALIAGGLLGFMLRGSGSVSISPENPPASAVKKKKVIWTCSMHPEIRQDQPGKCPKCGMTLIPLKLSSSEENSNTSTLKLSPSAEKLAEIQTFPVERKFIYSNINMTGKVAMNEQLIAYITARMPGRIDKLFVNYTGIPVRKGDHMAEYYSPELLVAQRELLLAVKDLKDKNSEDSYSGYGMSPEKMLATVKKKLEYWGLTDENLKKITESGEISQHITLYAPVGGIVTEKNAVEGKYFKTGDRLFTIADLSNVWIMLEAYEADVPMLRYGQSVTFTTEAYPGEVFEGKISFIDPVLNEKLRIINVRVDAPNMKGRLKPGMFVKATVKSLLSANGDIVLDSSLDGKWICPMHPGVIEDAPGKCPLCGMSLVKAESLGYAPRDAKNIQAPLIIPVTAPLLTGKRAVVYLKTGPGTFEGREVILGPRGDGYYVVKKGLKEGDLVVTSGNFKIDSALQIQGKPSMMTPAEAASTSPSPANSAELKVPEKFINALDMIYSNYFKVQKALADDNLTEAKKSVKSLKMMLAHIPANILDKAGSEKWKKINSELAKIAKNAMEAKDINSFRADFANLSASVESLNNTFGSSSKFKPLKFFCPMACDNKGANWLQNKNRKTINPYFGKAMQECGDIVE